LFAALNLTLFCSAAQGAMEPLPLTLISTSPSGQRQQLTPAPPSIIPPAAAAAVQEWAVKVADGIGLRGLVQMDGWVQVDSGQLVLMDVKPFPKLVDGHPLFQQVKREGGEGLGFSVLWAWGQNPRLKEA
jgi:hypothetical protein